MFNANVGIFIVMLVTSTFLIFFMFEVRAYLKKGVFHLVIRLSKMVNGDDDEEDPKNDDKYASTQEDIEDEV